LLNSEKTQKNNKFNPYLGLLSVYALITLGEIKSLGKNHHEKKSKQQKR